MPGGPLRVLPDGEAPEAVAAEDFDDTAWDTIPVPAHWVLTGDGRYGRPAYTNVQFPFPIDPPHVPDENPTGDYRRRFTLPDAAGAASSVLLRFDGVESRYKVWLNGVEIGVGSGSRLAQEFDITHAARAGENLLVVRVHQWSAASYLEDQDQWWMPGIFRDVTVLLRPAGALDDVWLRTGFDGGRGSIDLEIVAAPDAYPVRLRVPELGIDVTWDSPADVAPVEVGTVEPWTAERPRLYDATVAGTGETVSLRLGFRTVEIRGDRFLVNGRQVIFHGVNRHETHPDRGRVFDEDWSREDLALMKRFNVNAIRTSHYPPHPRLLDLADELGFWVIDECDYETHGFEPGGWVGNPSDDLTWRPALLDRMERTVERDKNHPCIVMWSLGNESGRGQNLAAMAAWVHDRDPGRPVHYEGDYTGTFTDVYSRMYAPVPEVEAIGRDDSGALLLGCSAAESARQRTKPFLLCEYVHAMGNGPGAIADYEALVERYPRLHGGFVWEWRDHGLRTRTPEGVEFFAYGGDFGEVVHDGNFVMDGLVLSDGTPSPGLHEFKQVVAPFTVSFGEGIEVRNRRHSADSCDVRFRWRAEHDGEPVASGVLDAPVIAVGDSVTLPLPGTGIPAPSDGELWLTVEAVLAEDAPWAPAGHVLVAAQTQLSAGRPATVRTPRVRLGDRLPSRLGPAEFDGGVLVALDGQPVAGPRLELWRAPTDNDRGAGFGSYDLADPTLPPWTATPAPALADTWKRAGLDRLTGRVLEVTGGPGDLRVVTRWAPADSRRSVLTDVRWTEQDGAVILRADIEPGDGWDLIWPRVGVRFDLPTAVDGARWFGTGPHESYPDSRRAALVGRYQSDLAGLGADYARPQETGHRSDLRSVTLRRGGADWLTWDAVPDTAGRLPGFTLSAHTAQQIARAGHPHELPAPTATHLYLDAAQHGLGSRACGPDVWHEFALRPRACSLRFVLRRG
ncbi:MAG: glycoside hydrolase family 2 TIM barrel-domain containing protein [Propioniciclava sp.]|uniref:glycoside hydrolase family 2 TIM barrel-domain containing protein n=1 Tax=Propioniciclava sp. TaxID=2038686 RepID=UPI0039E5A21D